MARQKTMPPQKLKFSRKTKEWRKNNIDWIEGRTFAFSPVVRKDIKRMRVNYDLLNNILHMDDLVDLINPDGIDAKYVPDKIKHYPIMNPKLEVLRGEEINRPFNWNMMVINPNSLNKIKADKKQVIMEMIQKLVAENYADEEAFSKELEQIEYFSEFTYNDVRELRCNELLRHFIKQYNMPLIFNNGFMDALTVAREIYQCDIVGGVPTFEKLDPLSVRIFKSGTSNKIEDADVIAIEEWWSPGRIIDTYYDEFSKLSGKARKELEEQLYNEAGLESSSKTDGVYLRNDFDTRRDFRFVGQYGTSLKDFLDREGYDSNFGNQSSPYDMDGNVRVLRVYWKSLRMIKKVKRYKPNTGEVIYEFEDEDYVPDLDKGEEATELWVNQAWEGTKIGKDIYVAMRPRAMQYNHIDNPSKCHFGIIGSIYNINKNEPFSLVDRMKQYNYLYDVIMYRVLKLIEKNWGIIAEVDLAMVPEGWSFEEWMYIAKTLGLSVKDSFKECESGVAQGKLAGSLNNASRGVINAEMGNSIMMYINFLNFIKNELSESSGVSKQREGQISNRETVGAVERSNLQSSHITEYIFMTHEDTKRRSLDAFVETAKIAGKGKSIQFQNITSTGARQLYEFDGDEFAENDYGLVMDNSYDSKKFEENVHALAQAALQNDKINFSAAMNLYRSISPAEKQRIIEHHEKKKEQQQREEFQAQQQQLQQEMETNAQIEQARNESQERMQMAKLQNNIDVAMINSKAEADRLELMLGNEDEGVMTEKDVTLLAESKRQFNEKMKLEREKLAHTKIKDNKSQALEARKIAKANKG